MLSAKGKVADRVIGLELGADDYMSKPFEPQEPTCKNSVYPSQGFFVKLNG